MENLKQLGDEVRNGADDLVWMNQSYQTWSFIQTIQNQSSSRVTRKGRACIFWFFCVLDQASKQLKEMSDQAKAVKEESTQDGAPLLAHGKATDSRSILKHRMRSPVKRLRSNGDRGTLVVRRSSALVAWRWAQISDHVVLY